MASARPPGLPTLLPNQIPPIEAWTLTRAGRLNENCWLFLYNLAEQVLGNQNATSSAIATQLLADSDTDASTVDPISLFRRVANLEAQQGIEPQQYATIGDVQQALQLAVSEDLVPIKVPGTGGGLTSVGLSDASTVPIYTVGASPLTANGTLTLTLKTETANQIFAGPTTGSAAQPNFRALVAADLPSSVIANSFTATMTAGTATATGTIDYLYIPGFGVWLYATSNIQPTANGTSLIMTGLPPVLQPPHTQVVTCGFLYNDSVGPFFGDVAISGGSLTFYFVFADVTYSYALVSDNVWSTGGSNGIAAGWSIFYPLL
jgi:hypothetical protein